MTQSATELPLETLTFPTARAALERALAALRAGQTEFDLGALKSADSSGVAVLLEVQRQARQAGRAVSFINPPVSLRSLLSLYGVDTLLLVEPAAATPQH
jgi:phospholipid transport system transporter-binding protein